MRCMMSLGAGGVAAGMAYRRCHSMWLAVRRLIGTELDAPADCCLWPGVVMSGSPVKIAEWRSSLGGLDLSSDRRWTDFSEPNVWIMMVR